MIGLDENQKHKIPLDVSMWIYEKARLATVEAMRLSKLRATIFTKAITAVLPSIRKVACGFIVRQNDRCNIVDLAQQQRSYGCYYQLSLGFARAHRKIDCGCC